MKKAWTEFVDDAFGSGGERRDDAGSMFLADMLVRLLERAFRLLGVTGMAGGWWWWWWWGE